MLISLPQPVAGVIGAAFSGVSIMVANILKLFRVRIINILIIMIIKVFFIIINGFLKGLVTIF